MKRAQHNEAWPLIVIAVVLLIGVGLVAMSCSGGDQSSNRPYEIFMSADVTTEEDLLALLPEYEAAGIEFTRRESSGGVTYLYERTIDGVKVNKDRILYLFDKKLNKVIGKRVHWRTDLPEHLPSLLLPATGMGCEGVLHNCPSHAIKSRGLDKSTRLFKFSLTRNC